MATQAYVMAAFLEARPALFRYAVSLERDRDRAEDLLHDVFLRAVDNAERYSTEDGKFVAWASFMMRNVWISRGRHSRKHPTTPLDSAIIETLPFVSPRQESNIRARELATAIMKVSPSTHRHALIMSGLAGMTYQEIADRQGVAEGTIKSRINRGRNQLPRVI